MSTAAASRSTDEPRADDGRASTRARALAAQRPAELAQLMERGEPPSLDALIGWEWRGLNTQWWAGLVGIRKFVKGFYRTDAGEVHGYNEPMVQNGWDAPWLARPRPDDPKRFGFFRVAPVDPSSRDRRYPNALLLDYGRGGNPRLDPSRVLRDYLVRVDSGSDELLLGVPYLALAGLRLRVPRSYFVLERHRPTTFRRP